MMPGSLRSVGPIQTVGKFDNLDRDYIQSLTVSLTARSLAVTSGM